MRQCTISHSSHYVAIASVGWCMHNSDMDTKHTIASAALALGLHRNTIRRMIDAGQIQTIQVGKLRRILGSEVRRLQTEAKGQKAGVKESTA